MKADYLRKALDLVPADAEILVTAEDMPEVPIEKFQYFEDDKTVWLILADEVWDDDDEEEEEDVIESTELSEDNQIQSLVGQAEPATQPPPTVLIIDGAAPDCSVQPIRGVHRPPLIIDAEYYPLGEEPTLDNGLAEAAKVQE